MHGTAVEKKYIYTQIWSVQYYKHFTKPAL